jgi:hypothetical protein
MKNDIEITLALQWFDENDIPAYCDNGVVYVQFGDCDIQISPAEVLYRAELQKEFGETNNQ